MTRQHITLMNRLFFFATTCTVFLAQYDRLEHFLCTFPTVFNTPGLRQTRATMLLAHLQRLSQNLRFIKRFLSAKRLHTH